MNNNNNIVRRKSSNTNLFSIDAILSKPLKTEKRHPSSEDEISPPYRSTKESRSPLSSGVCCSSPPNRYGECHSPHCQSPPSRLSPHRPEFLTFYRRSDFQRAPKEFHYDRRIIHEPTMVPMEKERYATGCANCQDCKMAEIRRFRFGESFILIFFVLLLFLRYTVK